TYFVFGKLSDKYGWPRAFLVTSGVTFAVALVWSLLGADHPPGAAAGPDKALVEIRHPPRFMELLRHRSLLCLTLSYAALGYFEYLFFYWAQYYFEKIQHLPKDQGRLYTTILTLAMGAGMVAGGWLTDQARVAFGSRRGLAVVPVAGLLL